MKALEFIPLIAFFIFYKLYGIIYATGAIVIATLSLLLINFLITKQKPNNFILFSSALMILMGSLTVFTSNTAFIKIKPTIFYFLCSFTLIFGLILKKNFVKSLFGGILSLDEQQWKTLSMSWIIFFLLAALSNELIWRTLAEEIWINFKVIFMPIITMLFMFSQIFFYRKYLVIEREKK